MKNKFLIIIFIIFVSLSGFCQELSQPKIINIAGKQRMLSQKMTKAKLCIFYKINVEKYQKEIKSSVILFDENLKTLNSLELSVGLREQLLFISNKWNIFKTAVETDSDDATAAVLEQNTAILRSCDQFVYSLVNQKSATAVDANRSSIALTVANCGSLRYLSQRIALYYLNGYKNQTESQSELKLSYSKFDEILQSLKSNQIINTPEIITTLEELNTLWTFQKSQNRGTSLKFKRKAIEPEMMLENLDKIYVIADKITKMYADL